MANKINEEISKRRSNKSYLNQKKKLAKFKPDSAAKLDIPKQITHDQAPESQ